MSAFGSCAVVGGRAHFGLGNGDFAASHPRPAGALVCVDAAGKQLLDAMNTNELPYVRNHIVAAIGSVKDDAAVAEKLSMIARDDRSYRARANALRSRSPSGA